METVIVASVTLPAKSSRDIVYIKSGINNYALFPGENNDVFYLDSKLADSLGYELDRDLVLGVNPVLASEIDASKRIQHNLNLHGIISVLAYLDIHIPHYFDYNSSACIKARYNQNREKWYLEEVTYIDWLESHPQDQLKDLQVYRLLKE